MSDDERESEGVGARGGGGGGGDVADGYRSRGCGDGGVHSRRTKAGAVVERARAERREGQREKDVELWAGAGALGAGELDVRSSDVESGRASTTDERGAGWGSRRHVCTGLAQILPHASWAAS